MLMNGDAQTVLAHPESLAMKKAAQAATREAQIESLYLGYLGRRPTGEEKTKVQRAFAQGMTLPELTWATQQIESITFKGLEVTLLATLVYATGSLGIAFALSRCFLARPFHSIEFIDDVR